MNELLVIPFYSPEFGSIFSVLVISLVWALAISWLLNRRFIFGLLNFIGISYSSETRSVWHDAFRRFHGFWGEVHLKDGTVISGWISHNSDDLSRPMILFQETEHGDIDVMESGEDDFSPSDSAGLLLLDENIRYIKFIDGID